jgi:nicotinamidase-related amidase
MSSFPIRNPQTDHLITPANSVFIIIDYQPEQVNSVESMDRQRLVDNIGTVAKIAQCFNVPIILSTVRVQSDGLPGTIPSLSKLLQGVPSYDRTSINAWEDKQFYEAVIATGRKKLIMAALWSEACLTFPSLDAMREGFEVYPIVDAVGGPTKLSCQTALRRLQQAGAQLTSMVQLVCELQRDWNRENTVPCTIDLLEELGAFLEM